MIKKILFVLAVSTALFGAGEALVNVDGIKKAEVNPLTEFIGTVNFENKSMLASESSGLVKKIYFEVGKRVKKGDLLISIDSSILDAQIKAQKAALKTSQLQLKNAKRDFDRYTNLLEKKSIAQKVYDDAVLAYDLAKQSVITKEANLKELHIQKNKKNLRAPYDGIIVKKDVDLSEWVNSGTAVAQLVNTSALDLIFNLPLNYIDGLDKNRVYEITLPNATLKAKLYAAIPSGDTLTRTFPVRFKAKMKKGFIFDGAQAKVQLAKNSKMEALVINRDAVIKRFGSNVVFSISDNKATMIPVKIIGFDGFNVAISGKGLVEGMNIVVKGNERVFPNQAVKVLNK